MNAMPCWQRGLRMHIKTIHRAAVYKHEFHIQLDAEQTFYPNQTLGVTWGDWFFPPQRPVFKTMFAASLLATKTTWRVSPLQKNCRATEADFFYLFAWWYLLIPPLSFVLFCLLSVAFMNVLALLWFTWVRFRLLCLGSTVLHPCTFRVEQWKQQTKNAI